MRTSYTDGSGAIGKDELAAAMGRLGMQWDTNELEKIIDEVDKVSGNFFKFEKNLGWQRRD